MEGDQLLKLRRSELRRSINAKPWAMEVDKGQGVRLCQPCPHVPRLKAPGTLALSSHLHSFKTF